MKREPASSGPWAELRSPVVADRGDTAAGSQAQQAHHLEGMALLQQGQLDQAESRFLRGARLDPKLAAAWNGMARIHAERGDFDQSCQASPKCDRRASPPGGSLLAAGDLSQRPAERP